MATDAATLNKQMAAEAEEVQVVTNGVPETNGESNGRSKEATKQTGETENGEVEPTKKAARLSEGNKDDDESRDSVTVTLTDVSRDESEGNDESNPPLYPSEEGEDDDDAEGEDTGADEDSKDAGADDSNDA